jgi:hypothetical protein
VAGLEQRLALSTLPLIVHDVRVLAEKTSPIDGSFSGVLSLLAGTHLRFTNVKLTFGKLKLSGTGFGTVSNGQLLDGELDLSGPKGKVTIELFGGTLKEVSKGHWQVNSAFVFTGATGGYAATAGFGGSYTVGMDFVPEPEEDPWDTMKVIVQTRGVVIIRTPAKTLAQQILNDIAKGYAPPPYCCR